MSLRAGTHRLGPEQGKLELRTYREGMAQKVGHDLVIDVTQWEATVEVGDEGSPSSIRLEVDPRSLQVRQGLRGLKPLSDRDRAQIHRDIDGKILHGRPISFRSSAIEPTDGRLTVRGELTLAGATRPVTYQLEVTEGRVRATLPVTQSDWGIKPYRGFMGALKVRDTVELSIDARLPRET